MSIKSRREGRHQQGDRSLAREAKSHLFQSIMQAPFQRVSVALYFLGKAFVVITGVGHVLKIMEPAWLSCWEIICTLSWCYVKRFGVLAYDHSLLWSAKPGSKQIQGPSKVADSEGRSRNKYKVCVEMKPAWEEGGAIVLNWFSFPNKTVFSVSYTVGTITWRSVNTGEIPDEWVDNFWMKRLDFKVIFKLKKIFKNLVFSYSKCFMESLTSPWSKQ